MLALWDLSKKVFLPNIPYAMEKEDNTVSQIRYKASFLDARMSLLSCHEVIPSIMITTTVRLIEIRLLNIFRKYFHYVLHIATENTESQH